MLMFHSRTGPFTVDMRDVFTYANLTLGVNLEGKVEVQDIQMDIISEKNIAVDFQNLGKWSRACVCVITRVNTNL